MASRKITTEIAFVYWLYDETCARPETDGYVGVTLHLKKRFREHCRSGRFPSSIKFAILFEGPWFECIVREYELRPQRMIGWNTGAGGGRSRLGVKHDAAAKEKMRIAKVGNKNALGWCPTPEQRAKIAAANKARSPEVWERTRNSLRGYKHTKEARANMGLSRVGRKVSAETRAKIGAANSVALRGKKHPDAVKQKMSKSQKAAWTPERRLAHAEQVRLRAKKLHGDFANRG